MKRRSFLKMLGMGGAAAAAPSIVKSLPISEPVKGVSSGFGLAQVKAEGSVVEYGNFAKALWPGINKFYRKAYDKGWRTLEEFEKLNGK